MAIFCMRIIHSKFFVWQFFCMVFFCMGKNPNIFCMVIFLYGNFYCVAIFLYGVFSCVRSQLLLIYTPSGSPPFC